ncbi:hypothetical protein FA15DRAFT_651512 [Coprinopsis marcescibilis]|uniref:Uncharacterized protein n=1 Tax=Coprinopsis marcescibilis TaxID=230819 RepID=A0A5C3LAR9_COPMA|nr:hypothetical protein FA15DRAFT_651512 [Coprinopsis marcescibilis]
MSSESPLTTSQSLELSQSPTVKRSGTARKRRLIASDDEDGDEAFVPVPPSTNHRIRRIIQDDDENEEGEDGLDADMSGQPPTMATAEVAASSSQRQEEGHENKNSKSDKGRRKSSHPKSGGRPPAKKARKSRTNSVVSEDDDFDVPSEMSDFEELEEERDISDEAFTDDEEDYGSQKKGRRAAGKRVKGKQAGPLNTNANSRKGRRSSEPGGSKAKSRVVSNLLEPSSEASKLVSKGARPDPLKLDEMDVDVVVDDQASQAHSSPMTTHSQAHTVHSSPPQHSSRQSSAVPVTATKKRKLPPIKKNKTVSSVSRPASPTAAKLSGVIVTEPKSSGLDKAIPTGPAAQRLPAAQVGVADVDLSNPNIYDQLFKSKGANIKGHGGAMGSRAKEEERKRELMALKEEWKAKRAAEQQQSPPFDLQAQTDKIARFEERLRATHSGALYPHYPAGKCKELYERNKMREKASAEGRAPFNGTHSGD